MYLAFMEADHKAYFVQRQLKEHLKDRLICAAKGFFMNKLIYELL